MLARGEENHTAYQGTVLIIMKYIRAFMSSVRTVLYLILMPFEL